MFASKSDAPTATTPATIPRIRYLPIETVASGVTRKSPRRSTFHTLIETEVETSTAPPAIRSMEGTTSLDQSSPPTVGHASSATPKNVSRWFFHIHRPIAEVVSVAMCHTAVQIPGSSSAKV